MKDSFLCDRARAELLTAACCAFPWSSVLAQLISVKYRQAVELWLSDEPAFSDTTTFSTSAFEMQIPWDGDT